MLKPGLAGARVPEFVVQRETAGLRSKRSMNNRLSVPPELRMILLPASSQASPNE